VGPVGGTHWFIGGSVDGGRLWGPWEEGGIMGAMEVGIG